MKPIHILVDPAVLVLIDAEAKNRCVSRAEVIREAMAAHVAATVSRSPDAIAIIQDPEVVEAIKRTFDRLKTDERKRRKDHGTQESH